MIGKHRHLACAQLLPPLCQFVRAGLNPIRHPHVLTQQLGQRAVCPIPRMGVPRLNVGVIVVGLEDGDPSSGFAGAGTIRESPSRLQNGSATRPLDEPVPGKVPAEKMAIDARDSSAISPVHGWDREPGNGRHHPFRNRTPARSARLEILVRGKPHLCRSLPPGANGFKPDDVERRGFCAIFTGVQIQVKVDQFFFAERLRAVMPELEHLKQANRRIAAP